MLLISFFAVHSTVNRVAAATSCSRGKRSFPKVYSAFWALGVLCFSRNRLLWKLQRAGDFKIFSAYQAASSVSGWNAEDFGHDDRWRHVYIKFSSGSYTDSCQLGRSRVGDDLNSANLLLVRGYTAPVPLVILTTTFVATWACWEYCLAAFETMLPSLWYFGLIPFSLRLGVFSRL